MAQDQYLDSIFRQPPASAKPWVFWYWMHASVSRAGITADLEAMKEAGIGGAYLMPIKGKANPPFINPPVEQLSPAWWDMVRFAHSEAGRLGLQLGMHVSDGFALAGGPWITPELSMQKVVWTATSVKGNTVFNDTLPQPETNEKYYRDIAVLAFPSLPVDKQTPVVSTSQPGVNGQFLTVPANKESFRSQDPCWIQYAYERPFTCYAVTVRTNGNNYQAHRLRISVSDNGIDFRPAAKLDAPRHGWQDTDAPVTHAITPVTARFFRFSYDKEGSEPGAEDLDAAKWKQSLKITGLLLSDQPRIHQFEGKSGAVWRISPYTTTQQIPDKDCIPLDKIADLTALVDTKGKLHWKAPAGNWTILRIGHTSTGHTNATGGVGAGLECDKFNSAAVRVQFDHWFGETVRRIGPQLADSVLKVFHVDSWECGSQNWSSHFREEFSKRRGYDLLRYLPAMAGYPVQNTQTAEYFLHDVRTTITELVKQHFYDTLAALAHAHGCTFSAESVAPTMTGDGMQHYQSADIPMGEYWLRSPTHDKPNDMLDAISGAHIYGKQIVQAEAFTELRMRWDEYPGMLKTLADRNYALGINKLVYHVFAHNPWTDQRPGMTLDGIGLYFQRNQTWWKPGRAWVSYAQRCQALLQQGRPVADVAVFTGEEIPRRAVLPERLISVLPGLFGDSMVYMESQRMANRGGPLQEMPAGVTASANITDPAVWVDALHGYNYDSFNKDALLRLATVKNGNIVLPGGAIYRLLVLPGTMAMSPEGNLLSRETVFHLRRLLNEGATILVNGPVRSLEAPDSVITLGNEGVIQGPWKAASFDVIGLLPDLLVKEPSGKRAKAIAWTHRSSPDYDIYFVSNQAEMERMVNMSFRTTGRLPELWDPVTGEQRMATDWALQDGRTNLQLQLSANGSIFIVFRKATGAKEMHRAVNWQMLETIGTLNGQWEVKFDTTAGGPEAPLMFNELTDWTKHASPQIRYYSGTATYKQSFEWSLDKQDTLSRVFLDLGRVANMAEVTVNGINCGVAWTYPYRVDITPGLREGKNELSVAVTNTWANRLIGDTALPVAQRITHTTAPLRLQNVPLLEAGLLGPVQLQREKMMTVDRVPATIMEKIYHEIKTPYKYGMVMTPPDDSKKLDCPSIFRKGGKWYMVYIMYDGRGYETWLAVSKDLLHWKTKGKMMSFADSTTLWDVNQRAGYISLQDYEWGGNYKWQSFRNKHWMTYIGGARTGYEQGLLSIGIANTPKKTTKPHEWYRFDKPALMATDSNAGWWENNTIYKSSVIWDKTKTTGYPFVMYYNAKGDSLNPKRGKERIGMAVSDDMEHWKRYFNQPVLDHYTGITGDAVIQRMHNVWVMFYFGAFWKNRPTAFNRFACSYDLVHWSDWYGEDLINSTEDYDGRFAHKSFVISYKGVVYHFYCAVNKKDQRGIAVATSKDLGKSTLNFTKDK
ncbi:glycosyl hydrolase [Chitinophaga sp. CF418]|uniref:glycosyl hydrolase n=1 Tax=Chitinophaga sp. CF418 TaxID=1855287 RepID=UPI000919AB34|nr:glycosyl hydrolase [Chitinophaga sp. CF418]SHM93157.1 Glycosyl hydrolases family 2, sugar binding domain [Chitinophaga sp. CF418]